MKRKTIVIIGVVVIALFMSILIPKALKLMDEKRKEKLITTVMQTKFDRYYDGDKFINEKLVDVLWEYKLHVPSRFDFDVECNEDCTGYDQIYENYDTEDFDYVCVYIQTKQQKKVDHATLIYFSISKATQKVKPFGIATAENNYRIEYVGEPDRVIGFAYDFMELMIEYN